MVVGVGLIVPMMRRGYNPYSTALSFESVLCFGSRVRDSEFVRDWRGVGDSTPSRIIAPGRVGPDGRMFQGMPGERVVLALWGGGHNFS